MPLSAALGLPIRCSSSDLSAQNLVKGGGGALLREKMVEVCAKQFVVIVDQSKLCGGLGPHFPVPVEIVSFCHEHTMRLLAALPSIAAAGCNPVLRLGSSANNKVDGEEVAITDNGNYIVDLHFEGPLVDPVAAANEILGVVGVVEQCVEHCRLTQGSVGTSASSNLTSFCAFLCQWPFLRVGKQHYRRCGRRCLRG
jgi:ribose 5-phosphate isomerase